MVCVCVCVRALAGASSGSRRMEDQVWQTTLHFATLPGSHAFGKLLHHIMSLSIAAQKYAIRLKPTRMTDSSSTVHIKIATFEELWPLLDEGTIGA